MATTIPDWEPGRSYEPYQQVRWGRYILICQRRHTAPEDAHEPWFREIDQPLKAALSRWWVDATAMREEAGLPPLHHGRPLL